MKNGHHGDRLSWGDALFLYLEREGMPLNIAGVSVFEGEISLPACARYIEAKLPLIPRYYQRVVTPPLNVGFPSWEDDPEFDIRNHIREITLKHGTETEFKAATGKILSTMLDRRHPLWDFTVVRGLKGNRTGMVVRAHHCLADGIAGVTLMNVLLDASPEPPPPGKRRKARQQRQARDPISQLLEGLISAYSDVFERVVTTQSNIVSMGEMIAGGWPADDFARFLPELAAPTERLFFNITYQGPQKFAWVKIPLADIKGIRERCGGKHNDVVLALMTATIRRYAELHGDKLKGRFLRMMVPVSGREHADVAELGNRISLLPMTVPLDIKHPRQLLEAVRERTQFLKCAHISELVGLAGGLLGATPAPLQALVGPVASLLPITPFNLVCTNIRGPEAPLYLMGRKMIEWYPYVPVGGEMALNCATLSYDGMTYFGFSGDVHAAPDLPRLENLLQLSFRELQEAAGIHPPRRRKIKKTARAVVVKTAAAAVIAHSVSSIQPQPVAKTAVEPAELPVSAAAD